MIEGQIKMRKVYRKENKKSYNKRQIISFQEFENLYIYLSLIKGTPIFGFKQNWRIMNEKTLRDLALIAVLGKCGLKANEIVSLKWKNVGLDKNNGRIIIENRKLGRRIPFGQDVRRILIELKYLRKRKGLPIDNESHVFFSYLNKNLTHCTSFMNRHSVKFIIIKLTKQYFQKEYSCEAFRNHAISKWIRQDRLSYEEVQKLAGYKYIEAIFLFVSQTE